MKDAVHCGTSAIFRPSLKKSQRPHISLIVDELKKIVGQFQLGLPRKLGVSFAQLNYL